MAHGRVAVLTVCALLSLAGCATYTERYQPVERALMDRGPDAALGALAESRQGANDRALRLLNKAALLRLAGKLVESNQALEEAKSAIAGVEATSVTETVASVTVNEGAQAYTGAPFEQVLLHVVAAFNYIELGDWEGARVEVLQANDRLERIAEDNAGGFYEDDAFARLIAGLVFERFREWSDALIAYRKSLQAYDAQQAATGVEAPMFLRRALLRLTRRQGLDDEHRALAERFDIEPVPDMDAYLSQGHLIVIVGDGLAPEKTERAIHAADPGSGQIHRVAVPAYRDPPPQLPPLRLTVNGKPVSTTPVEDVDTLARKNLERRMPGIIARSVARVAAKNKVVDQARERTPALGVLANVFTLLTERADTRGWTTLPRRYLLAEISLPPGRHDLTLQAPGIDTYRLEDIELRAGERRFVFYRRLGPGVDVEPRVSPLR